VNADIHGSAEYRRAMTAVFAGRALAAALARS
jgi:CO/xanthine dehydrogenase FAD-binding subunit